MGTAKTNQLKKTYIWKKINEQSAAGLGYSEKKLIAEFILDCNTSRKTAIEILKTLEDAERIIKINGSVFSLAYFDRQGKSIEIKNGQNGAQLHKVDSE